jgi:hypothetical protein
MRIYALVKAQTGGLGRFVPGTREGLVGDRAGRAGLHSTGLLPLGTTAHVRCSSSREGGASEALRGIGGTRVGSTEHDG